MEIINENYLPKNSLVLYGLQKYFNSLIELEKKGNLPQTLILSGKKGLGKYTLVNHFLSSFFDKESYDLKNFTINSATNFYKMNKNDYFQNILYLPGSQSNKIKIDAIRDLKISILKKPFFDTKRFIIFDDVELFNLNCLNALLKIIEEPPANNYFILINNKSKNLVETIHSRCIEFNISLTEDERIEIIELLINKFNLNVHLDYKSVYITPGNFLIFNDFCEKYDINVTSNFLENLEIMLSLYKKNKDSYVINMILFLIDQHFNFVISNNKYNSIVKVNDDKLYLNKSINNFVKLNTNQNLLLKSIQHKLNEE